MVSIRLQYLLLYHTTGSIAPFLAVFLRDERGFTQAQVGVVVAISSLASMIMPGFISSLADTRFDARRLAAALFLVSACGFVGIAVFQVDWVVILFWSLHSFAYVSIGPLHDGMYFSQSAARLREGKAAVPYHRVRVWGTFGFILPSIWAYLLIGRGWSLGVVLVLAIVSGLLAMVNTFRIDPSAAGGGRSDDQAREGIPAVAVLRILFSPRARIFCIGMILAHLGSSIFHAFYPVYLREAVGIDASWIGLIYNVGVVLEVFFMLCFAWFLRHLGMRQLMAFGILAAGARVTLLTLFPTVPVAILVQLAHGPYILAMVVATPIFLNGLAEDRFRNSIQGVYHMLLAGFCRIPGSLLGGILASHSLTLAFSVSAAFSLVSAAVFLLLFKHTDPSPKTPET